MGDEKPLFDKLNPGRLRSIPWGLVAVALMALTPAAQAEDEGYQSRMELASPITLAPLLASEVKLKANDAAALDELGLEVAVDGSYAVIGARFADGLAVDSGAAYVFERDSGDPDLWIQVKKLVASDGASGDVFGQSVAIDGTTIVVGALADSDLGLFSGSAYIFERDQGGPNNWGEVKKLLALSNPNAGDFFGSAVDISGPTIAVGTVGDRGFQGAVHVFERDLGEPGNWGEVTELVASDGAGNDNFGDAVALSGDTLVIGAPRTDDIANDAGSVYVFERDQGGPDNWGEVTEILAGDGAADDVFGSAVAISGDTLIVGTPNDDDGGADTGSAYVFERDQGGPDSWGEVKKLLANDGSAGDFFGSAVAIDGDVGVVGTPFKNVAGADSGAVYIYRRNLGGSHGWGQAQRLVASDGAADDQLGIGLAVNASTVVAGARFEDTTFADSGAAYLYRLDLGSGPQLAIPGNFNAIVGEQVTLPIELTANGESVAAIAFSLDYDEGCLSFDDTDGDFDGIPDDLAFTLPPSYSPSVFFDLGDSDGELDVVVVDIPPTVVLPDGPFAAVTLTVICNPAPSSSLLAPVLFAADPPPSFGDDLGTDLPGTTAGTTILVSHGLRGDCNDDAVLSAADLVACGLELFDGDGSSWLAVAGGTYPGSPVGCDANADTVIDAGDVSCKTRLLFGLACGGAASQGMAAPELVIPARITAPTTTSTVVVPVAFAPSAHAISSVVFSLELDSDAVRFNEFDSDSDGMPDAVRFIGVQSSLRSVSFVADDAGAKLDFLISDFSASPARLREGTLVEIELEVLSSAPELDRPVVFWNGLRASFGDVLGRSIEGRARVEDVVFSDGFESGYLSAWTISAP